MLRVLVVDDEKGLRVTMGEFLRAEGYEVDTAADARAARELLEKRDHHVVLADIILPEGSGLSLLGSIRTTHPDTTVVMITGEPSFETAAEAVRAGAFDYVPKPLSKDTICSVVAKAARVAELQRENRQHRERLEARVAERTAELETVNRRLASLLEAHENAEDALRESERRYRLLAENISDIIWSLDLDLCHSYVSPSAHHILGYDPGGLRGRPLANLVTSAAYAEIRELVTAALAREDEAEPDPHWSETLEVEHRRADGSPVWLEVKLALHRDESGAPVGVLGISRDITERRAAEATRAELEEQLRHSQQMEALARLAGGVAVDFNNLLSAILGYATFMKESLRPQDALRSDVAQVESAARRAADLTRQLLAFSRRELIAPQVVDLNEVITDLGEALEQATGEAVKLRTSLAPDLGLVRVDPKHIEEVLINVIVNGREAMPDGGELTIETSDVEASIANPLTDSELAPGTYVRVGVSDTGVGMDARTARRAFEPFFTTKAGQSGAGLGLSTVYGTVKQAGGDVRLHTQQGHGTTVEIFLPASTPEQELRPSRGPARPFSGSGETVLVAEDDEAVRRLTQRILETHGYRVVEAGDGDEALHKAKAHDGPVHLLLADVLMPGMSGGELAEELAKLSPGLRVVFMSGYTDGVVARRGSCAEDVAVLQKPFTVERLIAAIVGALSAE